MAEYNFNELKSMLEEKIRIEKFLRSEVKSLWTEINRIKQLPFFNYFDQIMSRFSRIDKKSEINSLQKELEVDNVNKITSNGIRFSKAKIDFLFLVPSDNQEIGGINTTFRLVDELINFGIKDVAVYALKIDPTVEKKEYLINFEQFKNLNKIRNIIITGIDCVPFYLEIKDKHNHNLIINLLGPDFMFYDDWNLSKKFLNLLITANLILCLTPYIEKILKSYNIKTNTFVTLLGPDINIFNLVNKNKRDKIIAVACRKQFEKGLKFALPLISVIRENGWRTIGFGDLPEHSIANEFDEYIGRISLEDLAMVFNQTKLLLDPSLIEGMGLTALEAASCGCLPIVMKRHSYDGIFLESEKPFIEISNLSSPEEFLRILNQDLNFEPSLIAKNQNLNFLDGSSRTIKRLIEFI